jgi:beta-mannosidase
VSYRHYGEDMARFVSEFGMHASPVLETLQRNVPAGALRFGSPELLYRNKDRPKDKGNMLMLAHTGLPGSLQEYIDFSMIAQAEGLKFGLEHYRRRKFHCSGSLFWQLNDCWPGLSWSVLDYYHFPKAGYFFAKRAYAPVMASFQAEVDGSVSLWIVNDTLAAVDDVAQWQLATFNGEVLHREEVAYSVPANAARAIGRIPAMLVADADAVHSCLWVRSQRRTFPANRHFFAEIKDLALPRPDLRVEIIPSGEELTVQVATDVYAYFVKIEVPVEGTRVGDNYFDMLPREARHIQLSNVTGREITPDDVVVSSLTQPAG